jgi:transposase InsO family protein
MSGRKKITLVMEAKTNKKALAQKLGISRSSLYYHSKLKVRDQSLKESILTALSEHPAYGHRRLAMHLARNKKCILRVMKKFGIKPYRRRGRRPKKPGDLGKNPLNIVNWAKALCPLRRNVLWASDFTYFWFHGRWWYLATIIDVFSREIVGFSFSGRHNSELVLSALQDALYKNPAPIYIHSDQGSEYQSYAYFDLLKRHKIQSSFSAKGSPWQNGFQESFYGEFKKDLGDTSRFETMADLLDGLYLQIHYYNNLRIHTVLKMPPALFRQHLYPAYQLS